MIKKRVTTTYKILEEKDGEEIVDPETECSPLDIFMPNTIFVKLKYIFAFDVSKFKSFERYTHNDW